jgi:hypothetical protein
MQLYIQYNNDTFNYNFYSAGPQDGGAGRITIGMEGKLICWIAFSSDKNKSLFSSGWVMCTIITLSLSGRLDSLKKSDILRSHEWSLLPVEQVVSKGNELVIHT